MKAAFSKELISNCLLRLLKDCLFSGFGHGRFTICGLLFHGNFSHKMSVVFLFFHQSCRNALERDSSFSLFYSDIDRFSVAGLEILRIACSYHFTFCSRSVWVVHKSYYQSDELNVSNSISLMWIKQRLQTWKSSYPLSRLLVNGGNVLIPGKLVGIFHFNFNCHPIFHSIDLDL